MNQNLRKKNIIKGGPTISDPKELVKGYPTGWGFVWMKPEDYDKLEFDAKIEWDAIHSLYNKSIPVN